MSKTLDAGIVTAYGAAVRGGYTGTYEEFCAEQAQFADNARQVAADRRAVEEAAVTFAEKTVPAAEAALQRIGGEQEERVEQAGAAATIAVAETGTAQTARVTSVGDAETQRVNEAGAAALAAINTAGETNLAAETQEGTRQVGLVNEAGTTQVRTVNAAGATQTTRVNTAGATQVDAIETRGAKVLASIPADYTELQNYALASYITSTASGNPATFDDGADGVPVKDLVVNIEPVQDLHGYDHPWPGGGGKNLYKVTVDSQTINGITYTVNKDVAGNVVSVTANGTASANSTLNLNVAGDQTLNSGKYILSGCPSGGSESTYFVNVNNVSSPNTVISDYGSGGQLILTTDFDIRMIIRVISGQTVSNLVFRPMIRLASETDGTFAPYSNICPITGWTGANVQRKGKNLLKIRDSIYISRSGITATKNLDADGNLKSITINGTGSADGTTLIQIARGSDRNGLILPVGDYIFSVGAVQSGVSIEVGRNSDSISSGSFHRYKSSRTGSLAFTNDEEWPLTVQILVSANTTVNDLTLYPMIRLASDPDSTFEPYRGETYTQKFVDSNGNELTVFGAKDDITGGTLTVTQESIVIDGSQKIEKASDGDRYYYRFNGPLEINAANQTSERGIISDRFISTSWAELTNTPNGCALLYGQGVAFKIAGLKTVEDYTQYFTDNPTRFVYKVNEPITYQLSPTEVKTRLGTNNIFADAGEVDVIYRADPHVQRAAQDAKIDQLFALHLTGDNTSDMFPIWWEMQSKNIETRYDKLSRWFDLLAKSADGKTYTLRYYSPTISSDDKMTPLDDLAGKTAAQLCTETTTPLSDWADEDQMTWYVRANALSLADGTMDILAIEGIDDDFDLTGETAPVYTFSAALWQKRWESGDYYYKSWTTTERSGYAPYAGDVGLDNQKRAMTWHPSFPGSLNSKGGLTSGVGGKPYLWASANNGITAARKTDPYEGLWNDADTIWALDMWQLRHWTLENSEICNGCQSYNYRYRPALAETGVKRVLLTPAQGANLIVGSNMELGEQSGTKNPSNDRYYAYNYNICKYANITKIEEVTIDSTTYAAVYLDVDTTFDTTTTCLFSTMPWDSGVTEKLPEHKDGALYSLTSGVAPMRLQGVELMDGAYTIGLDPLYNVTNFDNGRGDYEVFECRDSEKLAGSITADYVSTGITYAQMPQGWQYIKKFFKTAKAVLFPEGIGGSSSGYYKSAFYGASSAGVRCPWRFGTLSDGAAAGLACEPGHNYPSLASWGGRPRLSGSGKKRGEWTA